MKDLEKKRTLCINRTTPFSDEELSYWAEWAADDIAGMIAGWQCLASGPEAAARVMQVGPHVQQLMHDYMMAQVKLDRHAELLASFEKLRSVLKSEKA